MLTMPFPAAIAVVHTHSSNRRSRCGPPQKCHRATSSSRWRQVFWVSCCSFLGGSLIALSKHCNLVSLAHSPSRLVEDSQRSCIATSCD